MKVALPLFVQVKFLKGSPDPRPFGSMSLRYDMLLGVVSFFISIFFFFLHFKSEIKVLF